MFKSKPNMMTNWKTSEQGEVSFLDTANIEQKYQEVFKYIFPNLNLDPQTPQGQIITALTQQDTADMALISEIINSFFYGGSGIWLDYWAYTFFGKVRKKAKAGEVVMTLEGAAGTRIPTDFEVSDGTLSYKNKEELIINQEGTIEGLFLCTTITKSVSQAQSITEIVAPLDGVERVYNKKISIPAVLIETDDELRVRCLESFGFKQGNKQSILNAVLDVEGVGKASIVENPNNDDFVSEGITLPPHSFGIIVNGGNFKDTDLGRAVAEAINKVKPLAGFMPKPSDRVVEYTIRNASDGLKQVEFNSKISYIIADTFNGKIKIEVNQADDFDGFQDKLKSLILIEVERLKIGQDLFASDLILSVKNEFGITLRSLTLAPKTADVWGTSITNNWSAVLEILDSDIEIRVI